MLQPFIRSILFVIISATATYCRGQGYHDIGRPGPFDMPVFCCPPCSYSICDPLATCNPDPALHTACIEVTFGAHTQWRICLEIKPKLGLWLNEVSINRSLFGGSWTPVLKSAGPTEIFVPYHDVVDGAAEDLPPCGPFRVSDIRWSDSCPNNYSCMAPISQEDVGANGSVITVRNDSVPRIGVECRDRGLAWVCKSYGDNNNSTRQRGQSLVIWGIIDAGNYDNIIQYTFRDDGVIEFRYGVSGYNSPGHPFMAHMHTTLWRIDADIAGSNNNTAYQTSHEEPWVTATCPNPASGIARDAIYPIKFIGGPMPVPNAEGFVDYDPLRFTRILVENSASLNRFSHPRGYEFVPWIVGGIPRHFHEPTLPFSDYSTEWTQHDFYVTRYHAYEDGYTYPTNWQETYLGSPDSYLYPYLSGESVANTDVVVWMTAAAHHDPSDEDRSYSDTASTVTGVTLIHWSGFDMVPHNFFDVNPLGSPYRCDP